MVRLCRWNWLIKCGDHLFEMVNILKVFFSPVFLSIPTGKIKKVPLQCFHLHGGFLNGAFQVVISMAGVFRVLSLAKLGPWFLPSRKSLGESRETCTLQKTKISPKNGILSRWFSFSPGGICIHPLEGNKHYKPRALTSGMPLDVSALMSDVCRVRMGKHVSLK